MQLLNSGFRLSAVAFALLGLGAHAAEPDAAATEQKSVTTATAAPTRSASKAILRWDVLEADGTMESTLARWARLAGWSVRWAGVPEIPVDGDVVISGDFMKAVSVLATNANNQGYPIAVDAYSNKVLVVKLKEPGVDAEAANKPNFLNSSQLAAQAEPVAAPSPAPAPQAATAAASMPKSQHVAITAPVQQSAGISADQLQAAVDSSLAKMAATLASKPSASQLDQAAVADARRAQEAAESRAQTADAEARLAKQELDAIRNKSNADATALDSARRALEMAERTARQAAEESRAARDAMSARTADAAQALERAQQEARKAQADAERAMTEAKAAREAQQGAEQRAAQAIALAQAPVRGVSTMATATAPAPTAATASPSSVAAVPKAFDVQASDASVDAVISRWGRDSGWDVRWDFHRIPVTKAAKVGGQDFLEAAASVHRQLLNAGYSVSMVPVGRTLVFRSN